MWIIFAVWAVFCLWVTGYCKVHAYTSDGDDIALVLGMPHWVFWGIAVPWCAASAFSIVFALCFMVDHPLEEIEPAVAGASGASGAQMEES